MFLASPGQSITISQDGLPSGESVGYQVIKAATQSVVIGRTLGVSEVPAGSGNYVVSFTAPVEADLYLIVLDWSDGFITPETSSVADLQVTTTAAAVMSGLGLVADQAKVAIGGSTFDGLATSMDFGTSFIQMAVDNVKARVMRFPPSTADEVMLPAILLQYLGKLCALELISAARDLWMTQAEQINIGNDPVENVTYPSRLGMLAAIEARLLDDTRSMWPQVLPIVDDPVAAGFTGPAIDEPEGMGHVTRDPRLFPREGSFPYHFPIGIRR